MMKTIAGVQTDVVLGETQKNRARLVEWLADPRIRDADLVVFPECVLSGYCFDSLDEAWPYAETIPGTSTQAIERLCREQRRFVAFGMLEQGPHGQLFNSCVLIGPEGIVAVYRKIHLPFLGIDRFTTPGTDAFQVHQANEMRIGLHICYDGIFPESGRVMSLDGADLLILPTNWPPGADTFAKYIPNARALENNVYFLSVNRVGTERGFRFIGQSKLCDTNGNTVAEAPENEEAIIIGQIDLERARNKRLVRVPGKHVIDRWKDRHPELYTRIVQPKETVRLGTEMASEHHIDLDI
jgi:5-aminopentanamidase